MPTERVLLILAVVAAAIAVLMGAEPSFGRTGGAPIGAGLAAAGFAIGAGLAARGRG